jgi:glycosyltransferase involved in cell wall biosynthesis
MKLHSFVIPVYNEEAGIPALVERLRVVMEKISDSCEVIFVNDGSRDRSGDLLDAVHEEDTRFKVVHLSRNFGHQVAITAGLEFAAGDTVTMIDADLQDPPEVALEFLAKWREGFEVVYGVRSDREGETFFKLFTAQIFYRLFRSINSFEMPVDAGDFRLLDRKVVDALLSLPERSRYLRGLVSWVGFRQVGIPYRREKRFSGHTNYTLAKMFRLAIDGVTSFSLMPLRIATTLGIAVSSLSFLAILYAGYLRFFTDRTVQGWTSLILVTLFLGGVQLFALGIIGEYVGRVLEEARGRPLYFVGRLTGMKAKERELPAKVRRVS